MDEQLLIDGCKRGEALARKELYELYAPAMMSVCVRYVRDRETARDLLQDGFIKVFTKIQTYSATGPFGAWVRRVFVTTALEYLRKYDALWLDLKASMQRWTAETHSAGLCVYNCNCSTLSVFSSLPPLRKFSISELLIHIITLSLTCKSSKEIFVTFCVAKSQ